MTLDEAIKHCEEVAKQEEYSAIMFRQKKDASAFLEKAIAEKAENDCQEDAAYHRQLAEWLTELKEQREIFAKADTGKATPKDYLDLLDEWAKMKKLLKAAVEDINFYVDCYEPRCDECCCDQNNHCHWKHEAEVMRLIEAP